jgi:aminoglycoside phosphotransferase (APT) family kinase protein
MAAVVDWEMSTVGDPLLDLGWVLMGWPDPDEDRGRSGPGSDRSRALYFDYTGMQSRAELMQRYASRSGLALDAIDYYVVLARFKMACVLEGGYARYVQGGADNPKMASFGEVVLEMARRAAELAATSQLPATR